MLILKDNKIFEVNLNLQGDESRDENGITFISQSAMNFLQKWLGNTRFINHKFHNMKEVQNLIDKLPSEKKELISDGYHTFQELYAFRKMYNAALFNEWAAQKGFDDGINYYYDVVKHNVHKSWRHYDGELCFGGGWFIVSAMLPTGLISNHYKESDWDLFKIPEVEKALFEYDGHTGYDVLERLKNLK